MTMSNTLTKRPPDRTPKRIARCRFARMCRSRMRGQNRKQEVIALRQQYLSPGLLRYYKDPLLVVEGHMQYLWDETGRRYLDGFAGIVTVSVGHCHPKVVKAVQEQVGKLQHTTTIYLNPTIGQFAKKLTEHMPAGVESCQTGISHQQRLGSE